MNEEDEGDEGEGDEKNGNQMMPNLHSSFHCCKCVQGWGSGLSYGWGWGWPSIVILLISSCSSSSSRGSKGAGITVAAAAAPCDSAFGTSSAFVGTSLPLLEKSTTRASTCKSTSKKYAMYPHPHPHLHRQQQQRQTLPPSLGLSLLSSSSSSSSRILSPKTLLHLKEEDSFDYDDGDNNDQKTFSSHNNNANHNDDDTSPIREYFATCIPGLSEILAQELIQIGAQNVEISGTSGVKFASKSTTTTKSTTIPFEEDIGMKAVMYVRTAHRIMELITSSSPSSSSSHYDNGYDDDSDYDNYQITNRDSLYDFIQSSLPPPALQSLLGNGQNGLLTLNVQIIMNNSKQIPTDLNHSHYNCLTVKNAIVDMVRDLRKDGMRPDVDLDDPDVPLMVVMRGVNDDTKNRNNNKYNRRRGYNKNQGGRGRKNNDYNDDEENEYYYDNGGGMNSVHVSLYRILHSGGSSLHRRGYRSSSNAIHKAAMKESLASGLLLQSGFDKLCHAARFGDKLPAVLVDPMCGSGTFCIKAAMIAADYAPGLMRMRCFDNNGNNGSGGGGEEKWNPHQIPPVVRWKDSNRDYWRHLVLEARDRASSGMEWMKASNTVYPQLSNCVIMANEFNPAAHDLANANIINSGFSHMISLSEGGCIDWDLHDNAIPGQTIVVANPPWGLRLTEDIEDSWMSLKSFLREQCNEAEAWVLSGSKSATRYLRMKKTRSVIII